MTFLNGSEGFQERTFWTTSHLILFFERPMKTIIIFVNIYRDIIGARDYNGKVTSQTCWDFEEFLILWNSWWLETMCCIQRLVVHSDSVFWRGRWNNVHWNRAALEIGHYFINKLTRNESIVLFYLLWLFAMNMLSRWCVLGSLRHCCQYITPFIILCCTKTNSKLPWIVKFSNFAHEDVLLHCLMYSTQINPYIGVLTISFVTHCITYWSDLGRHAVPIMFVMFTSDHLSGDFDK